MLDSVDPYYLAIIDQSTNQVIGTFALMRIDSKNRVIEVGWFSFSKTPKNTTSNGGSLLAYVLYF